MYFYHQRVQESDGSFFESFTALSWKRENRRMSSIRAAETRAEALPPDEKGSMSEDEIETSDEREKLYMDVLHTITNSVGCHQQSGQVKTYFTKIKNLDKNFLCRIFSRLTYLKQSSSPI